MTSLLDKINQALASDSYRDLQGAYCCAKYEGYYMDGIKGNAKKSELVRVLTEVKQLESYMSEQREQSATLAADFEVPSLAEAKAEYQAANTAFTTKLDARNDITSKFVAEYLDLSYTMSTPERHALIMLKSWANGSVDVSRQDRLEYTKLLLHSLPAEALQDLRNKVIQNNTEQLLPLLTTKEQELVDNIKTKAEAYDYTASKYHKRECEPDFNDPEYTLCINALRESMQQDIDKYERDNNCKLVIRGNSVYQEPLTTATVSAKTKDTVMCMRVSLTGYFNDSEYGLDRLQRNIKRELGRELTESELEHIRELSRPALSAVMKGKYDGFYMSELVTPYLTELATATPEPVATIEIEPDYAHIAATATHNKSWDTNVAYNRIPRRVRRRAARFYAAL